MSDEISPRGLIGAPALAFLISSMVFGTKTFIIIVIKRHRIPAIMANNLKFDFIGYFQLLFL